MKRLDLVAAAALAGLAGYVLFESRQLGFGSVRVPQTGFFPRVLGILLLLLALADLFRALRQAEPALFTEKITGVGWIRLGATLATMLGFAVVLERVGFLVATFFLMVLLLRAIEAPRWPKVLLVALVTSVLSYGLFAWLLGVPLPAGILGI
ncbi:MAG TPA: tripartite tricarboxylate transporter TctB family protein [Candidatus Binatia bacterium]|nr:tripartite tricarboxylate transporter TctB family protein [Candidatus Binatia bacterium]